MPFPSAPIRAFFPAELLSANAASEFGSDRLLIGGISAGGHLAAATLLHRRDADYPAFVKSGVAALLQFPLAISPPERITRRV